MEDIAIREGKVVSERLLIPISEWNASRSQFGAVCDIFTDRSLVCRS